jgi:CheY-like chemotaxis protein
MYTILIVDDDPGLRTVTQASIERLAGWQTLLAGSGREGLTMAQQAQPDAILLDVAMPDMNGLTTLQHLQSNPLTQPIPVILFTSLPPIRVQQLFAGLPLTGLIHKPFQVTDLVPQRRSLLHWYD